MNKIKELLHYKMENGLLVDDEALSLLQNYTTQNGRELLITTDAHNTVLSVNEGDHASAPIQAPDKMLRHKGVRRYKVLHTHPGGNYRLSEADFSAARGERPAVLAAVAFHQDGRAVFEAALPFVNSEGELAYEASGPLSYEQFNRLNIEQRRERVNAQLREGFIHDDEHENRPERVILIGVDTGDATHSLEASMEELRLLAQTAGGEPVGSITQARRLPDTKSYLGKGKVSELALLVQNTGADTVIVNDDLSSVQIASLEAMTGAKVIDRTALILDIFAAHARSAEGRIQVELAQLRYRRSRLRGLGKVLSRTGGGIGTRGPGEKKLETDRRLIDRQLWELERKFEKISKTGKIASDRRTRSRVKTVSLVGYTNAGKSTLFNKLTDSEVPEKDALFVTLDSTVRKSNDSETLFSDTVGFIDKLPHELVRAFRSTLEETKHADVLLHVMDASDPNLNENKEVVENVLREIGCLTETEQILLPIYNKLDRLNSEQQLSIQNRASREGGIAISAKTGEGLNTLKQLVEDTLHGGSLEVHYIIPFEKGGLLSKLYDSAENVKVSYPEEGISAVCVFKKGALPRELEAYKVEEN